VSLVLRSLPVNVEILELLKSPLDFSNISEIEGGFKSKRDFKTISKSVVSKQFTDILYDDEKRP